MSISSSSAPLQWLGTPELRERMEGRLVLVHLLCRDAVLLPVENLVASSTDKALQGSFNLIYRPCFGSSEKKNP